VRDWNLLNVFSKLFNSNNDLKSYFWFFLFFEVYRGLVLDSRSPETSTASKKYAIHILIPGFAVGNAHKSLAWDNTQRAMDHFQMQNYFKKKKGTVGITVKTERKIVKISLGFQSSIYRIYNYINVNNIQCNMTRWHDNYFWERDLIRKFAPVLTSTLTTSVWNYAHARVNSGLIKDKEEKRRIGARIRTKSTVHRSEFRFPCPVRKKTLTARMSRYSITSLPPFSCHIAHILYKRYSVSRSGEGRISVSIPECAMSTRWTAKRGSQGDFILNRQTKCGKCLEQTSLWTARSYYISPSGQPYKLSRWDRLIDAERVTQRRPVVSGYIADLFHLLFPGRRYVCSVTLAG